MHPDQIYTMPMRLFTKQPPTFNSADIHYKGGAAAAEWAKLPRIYLYYLLRFLNITTDIFRLRAVCRRWREALPVDQIPKLPLGLVGPMLPISNLPILIHSTTSYLIGEQVFFIGFDTAFSVAAESLPPRWRPGSICLFNNAGDHHGLESRFRLFNMEEEEKDKGRRFVSFDNDELSKEVYTGLFFPPPPWTCSGVGVDNAEVELQNLKLQVDGNAKSKADDETILNYTALCPCSC